MRDVFQLLTRDHENHRDWIEALKNTSGDTARRRALFAELRADLGAHAVAEERTLYAAMLSTKDGQPEASHSVHEHEQIDDLLDELTEMGFDNPAWLRKLDELRERVLHHEDEEEEDTFPVGREVLDSTRAVELAEEFLCIKSEERAARAPVAATASE